MFRIQRSKALKHRDAAEFLIGRDEHRCQTGSFKTQSHCQLQCVRATKRLGSPVIGKQLSG
jgi:hypothetical protein